MAYDVGVSVAFTELYVVGGRCSNLCSGRVRSFSFIGRNMDIFCAGTLQSEWI